MKADTTPSVAAIIPTRGERRSLHLAIQSVANQDTLPRELIVIFDAPEPLPVDFKDLPPSITTHILCTGNAPGGNRARNLGVQVATARLVSFLDDDDLWHPNHLTHQVRALLESDGDVCYSFAEVRRPDGKLDRIIPTRTHNDSEPLSDYLFRRRKLRGDEGRIQTSTITAKKSVAESVPFDPELRLHQDWDWILRIDRAGRKIISTAKPTVTYVQHDQGRISMSHHWRESMEWALTRRSHFSDIAWDHFLLFIVGGRASKAADFTAVMSISRRLVWAKLSPRSLVLFAIMFTRNSARTVLRGLR